MSLFIDKLSSIYKTSAPTIGFQKPKNEADKPSILIASYLSKVEFKKIKTLNNSGVEAAIFNVNDTDPKNFSELENFLDTIPVGIVLDNYNKQTDFNKIAELEFDFMIFGLQSSTDLISKGNYGKILKIDYELAPGVIRAINELDPLIDAVMIDSNSLAITFEKLLYCQLFSSLINKPLLINVDTSLTINELTSLHNTGIKGIVLPEGTPVKMFAELKHNIDTLPKTRIFKTKTGVILPHINPLPETTADDTEEEEDDI